LVFLVFVFLYKLKQKFLKTINSKHIYLNSFKSIKNKILAYINFPN
jgi:hypothetical protein